MENEQRMIEGLLDKAEVPPKGLSIKAKFGTYRRIYWLVNEVEHLRTGLRAAMAAIEYACAEAPHATDEILAHVNGFAGSQNIQEFVKQLESR